MQIAWGAAFTPATRPTVAMVAGLLLYFLPTVIASIRDINGKKRLLVHNLLLGWTFFGWLVLLSKSIMDLNKDEAEELEANTLRHMAYGPFFRILCEPKIINTRVQTPVLANNMRLSSTRG
jgi:hypothetical protein